MRRAMSVHQFYDTVIYQTISINVQAASEVNYLFVKIISIFTHLALVQDWVSILVEKPGLKGVSQPGLRVRV
jgi:hypothetical protein